MSRHAFALPGEHDSTREGAVLGIAMATTTWALIALIDSVVGAPFHTFAARLRAAEQER